MITTIHYMIHRKDGEPEKVKLTGRLSGFYEAAGITAYDLSKGTFPWYMPKLGITIIGYEKTSIEDVQR